MRELTVNEIEFCYGGAEASAGCKRTKTTTTTTNPDGTTTTTTVEWDCKVVIKS